MPIGNPFPRGVRWPAVAQFRDTLVIAGGYDDGTYLDAVYVYEPHSDLWAPSPENMTFPRYGATAIAVPTTVFPDCE